jgi:hypothetical protein
VGKKLRVISYIINERTISKSETETARCERAEFTTNERFFSTMNSLPEPVVRGKPAADTASERDFTLSVFRTAAARQRLAVNSLETIGTALRNKLVDCAGAMRWAQEEGVIGYLVLGPTGAK